MPSRVAHVLEQLLAAAQRATERAADPDPRPAERLVLREEAVEAHRVVHLGRRELQQLGDLGHRLRAARSADARCTMCKAGSVTACLLG